MSLNRFWPFILKGLFIGVLVAGSVPAMAQDDGSRLWFGQQKLKAGNEPFKPAVLGVYGEGETIDAALEVLKEGVAELFGSEPRVRQKSKKADWLISLSDNSRIATVISKNEKEQLGEEGFLIRYWKSEQTLIVTANTESGLLYGSFHLLRLLQTVTLDKNHLDILEVPAYQHRVLNHWDNLDGSVERGYAGRSVWKWDELPATLSPRYLAYAKANASIGINGTVLNNVNANPQVLNPDYLGKVQAIADVLRPYAIKVYLAVNFASPQVLGGLEDASPENEAVVLWWHEKVKEIYRLIPDFGGFLVKANSEGQPGPMDFGCTHADGANMLADALHPHGGIVMWRAFVYNPSGDDRAKQAYEEFMPFDGRFRDNVMIQVKNGPVDFQPREPFSPLFGGMTQTALMPELQITKEYLGFSDHLVYLGTLFQEFLLVDTYSQGQGSTIARETDGSMYGHRMSGIAGVANIGDDSNWCGHPFAQANWYVFGRLAWDPEADIRAIAGDWVMQTILHEEDKAAELAGMMMLSREAAVNYMTPLGLHHLMGWDHHYGPEPWCEIPGARPDWLPSYYHKADSAGVGFDRSTSGSNAVNQYHEPLRQLFNDPALCPPEYLLWFHHVDWGHEMINGRTLWMELCYRYQEGVDEVRAFIRVWKDMESEVDKPIYNEVSSKLEQQLVEAIWWKDACLLYFQTFSERAFPKGIDAPVHQLDELKKLKFDLKHHN